MSSVLEGAQTLTATRPGRLDAVKGVTHPKRRNKAVEVQEGDVLEIATEQDWPCQGASTQMVRVLRGGKLVGKAQYYPSSVLALTRE